MNRRKKIRWQDRIENNPLYHQLVIWSRQYSIPGFMGVTIYDTLSFLKKELQSNDLNVRASSISYSFFIALFPSLIFLFTVTAYLPKSLDFYHTLENSIISLIPDEAGEYLWKNIISGLRPKAEGSILSIGFILAVLFASSGMLSLMRGFDKTYKSSFRRRSWIEKQGVAILLTFLLGLLLIVSVVLLILWGQMFKWLLILFHLKSFTLLGLKLLQYLVVTILFYSVIASIYRFGPALHKPLGHFSPGSIFATVTSILTSVLFGYFVDNFSTYHKVYGAISALIITLIWIRLNVMILIMGFELNAAIIVNRDLKAN